MRALWAELVALPLFWTAVTLVAFVAGDQLFRRTGRNPLANPVLVAIGLLVLALWGSGTSYDDYFASAKPIHLMLGPATVALAVPLQQNFARVRSALWPIVVSLIAGSLTAIGVAVGVAYALGVRGESLLSIAPKSATAPVAMGVAEGIGGLPTLTAVLVVLTGVSGAVMAIPLLRLIGVTDWRARGFAMGLAAHGIGTAAAVDEDETGGAFAGLGMGLNALLTAAIVPILVALAALLSQ